MRLVLLASVMLTASGALAQELGDPAAGQWLAQSWCTECHQIAYGRTEISVLKPPSFYTIAARTEVTPLWLNTFFQTPHPVMPNIILTPSQRDDIAAYILDMKRR
ncbi:MAG: cytochrome c [Alphaproteobacteria bacterium]|nr:cytochrome c [Alphaproteobacteria bacterium]